MPFGTKNMPAHFQRMMGTREFHQKLSEDCLILYIDNITVFSITWEEHLKNISRVLSYQNE
jgi:hypothetical protein